MAGSAPAPLFSPGGTVLAPGSLAGTSSPTAQPAAPTTTPAPSYASVTPQQAAQPAREPAVVSSSSIDNVIPDNNQKLADLSQKGAYQGNDGNLYYGDGTIVPAPPGSIDNGDGTYTSTGGQTFNAPPSYVDNPGNDPQINNINNLLGSLKMSTDSATKKQLDAIHQQYDALISDQTQANSAANAGRQNALLMGGSARYAPIDESSAITAQVSFGLSQIQKLEAAETAAIANVESARDTNNQKLMDQALSSVETIRTQKQAAAQKISDQLQAAAQKRQDAQEAQLAQGKQAARDTQIASAVQQGFSDPGKLLEALNYDENGKQVGDYTAAEVGKTLATIATNTGAAGIKGLTGDVGNFYALKNTPGALPASILALPADQQLAGYIKMVNEAKKGVASPASGATSSAGATQPSPTGVTIDGVPDTLPVVGFDPTNGPNQQDQASFLRSLPGGETGKLGALIKGLSDYSINPNTFPNRLFKGQQGITSQQIIPLVKQYDPSYNENNFTAAQAMQKSITSGTYSQVVNSANTLIAHLQLLSNAAHQLPGGSGVSRSIPLINTGANKIASAFGSPSVTNFRTAVNAVGSEAAKIYKGTGVASDDEIKQWQGSVGPDSSDEQIQGAVHTIVQLMAGRLASLSDSYQQTMGKPYARALLTPQSAQILTKLGVDPSEVDPLYGNSPAAQLGSSNSLSSFLSSAPTPQVTQSSAPAIDWSGAHF